MAFREIPREYVLTCDGCGETTKVQYRHAAISWTTLSLGDGAQRTEWHLCPNCTHPMRTTIKDFLARRGGET